MAKVTSKLQVTIPQSLALRYSIRPGDSISFQAAGDVIQLLPPDVATRPQLHRLERLALFDAGTERQRARESGAKRAAAKRRGWTRDELYRRGPAD